MFKFAKAAAIVLAVIGVLALLETASADMPVTVRVSVDSHGVQGNDNSGQTTISPDGRYVVFLSAASNLVPNDTNGFQDVFVYDRNTGSIERVSVDSSGGQANSASYAPPGRNSAISADDRYVVFQSGATNLVPAPGYPFNDIFVPDRLTGITERESVSSSGERANNNSQDAAISADGRYVAFTSDASNLVANDTNHAEDVFVHDRHTGSTERVSVDGAGNEGNGQSWRPAISGDGRFVAYTSDASNIAPPALGGGSDVLVHDRQTGLTERVGFGPGTNQDPAISPDGRYVVFESNALTYSWNVYIHDRQLGTTELVSRDVPTFQSQANSVFASVSADGRYVAFDSSTGQRDSQGAGVRIFVRDRLMQVTTQVDVNAANQESNGDSELPSISADGRFVTYESSASNLVPGDTNSAEDVFVTDLRPNETQTPAPSAVGGSVELTSGELPTHGDSAPALLVPALAAAIVSLAVLKWLMSLRQRRD